MDLCATERKKKNIYIKKTNDKHKLKYNQIRNHLEAWDVIYTSI